MSRFNNNIVNNFFSKHSNSWIYNGYNNDGYNYPVAAKRLSLVKKILFKNFRNKKLKILDIGCGGGHVSLELANDGHIVRGIDQSVQMIEISSKHRDKLSKI